MTQTLPSSAASAEDLPSDLTERLRELRDGLLTGLVERDVPVRLGLLGALAGEHLLLIGPPGTAKSLIASRLHRAFEDATYFERLLTRFTVPEELFGPLSIKGLEQDRYERLTEGYLPTASIAFLDEIFKANSAILNALLTLLNERAFDNGNQRVRTPLVAVVGASNELPEGEELDALYDRFLLRVHVGPVSSASFPALIGLVGESAPALDDVLPLSASEVAAVQRLAHTVVVPDDVTALLCDLRTWCRAEQIRVSDRRWRKVVQLLQVSALTNGREAVSIWDCWLLQHCLWEQPDQREALYEWYAARVGASAAMDPSRLTKVVVSWEAKLARDQSSRSQARDADGALLYSDGEGKPTTEPTGSWRVYRDGEPLFLAPANAYNLDERTNGGAGYTRRELDQVRVENHWQSFREWNKHQAYLADESNLLRASGDLPPLMEPTRHKVLYIEHCEEQLVALTSRIAEYAQGLDEHLASLEAEVRGHVWLVPDFAEPAKASLDETQREVESLAGRVQRLRDGFDRLPREREADSPDDGPAA